MIHIRMKWIRTSFIVLFLCLTAVASDYQEILSVELVRVYVTAKDSDGRFITDLRPEELTLRENGEPQEIVDFTNLSNQPPEESDFLPLTVAFSMDISGSMSGLGKNRMTKIDLVKKAAMALVPELRPQDKMAVFGFHSLPKLIVPMTSDPRLIEHKLKRQRAVPEETALFDSLYMIVDQLEQHEGRKIIVLGSDGEDTSSHISFERLVDRLKKSDVMILAFGMQSIDLRTPDKRYILEKLAQASGGYAFFPTANEDLENIISKIRRIIRSQYVIWYSPQTSSAQTEWRSIQVICNRPGAELRFRNGYYSKAAAAQRASEGN